jgi:tripartite ATP-independent transporter DctP family solute receptor
MNRFFFACSLAVAGVLASCAGSNEPKATNIKISFNLSTSNPQYKALRAFGDAFEKETNGQYTIEIFPNELLGDQRASLELVQSGVIHMAAVANPVVENFNPEFAVIGLPYLYHSLDHQQAVFTSDALRPLFDTVTDNGFVVLGAYTAGARSVYTNKPINRPEDLNGYKLRVMQSDTMRRMIDAMGGVGTPMAQGEVYTAIQQGVLEGAENSEMTYVDLKHYEIAPFFSDTQHLMIPDLIIINRDFFQGMSAEHQAILRRLIRDSIINEFAEWAIDVSVAREEAIKNGATFVTVDKGPFIERVQPLHVSIAATSPLTQSVYDNVAALVVE